MLGNAEQRFHVADSDRSFVAGEGGELVRDEDEGLLRYGMPSVFSLGKNLEQARRLCS
jgi:hypothetical protein